VTDQPGVTIEPFTMDDYPVVHVLWQRAGLCVRPSDGPGQTLLKLARDRELFLVARIASGALVGTVMGGWDGRRAYVYHLAVLPERQRQGVAGLLMDERWVIEFDDLLAADPTQMMPIHADPENLDGGMDDEAE